MIYGLRRLVHGKAHRQPDDFGGMLVISLDAAKAEMLAAGFNGRHDQ